MNWLDKRQADRCFGVVWVILDSRVHGAAVHRMDAGNVRVEANGEFQTVPRGDVFASKADAIRALAGRR